MVGEAVTRATGGHGRLTETVERPGLPVALAGLPVQSQSLPVVPAGPVRLPEAGVQHAETVVRPCLAGAVAELAEQGQGSLEVRISSIANYGNGKVWVWIWRNAGYWELHGWVEIGQAGNFGTNDIDAIEIDC